MKHFFSILFFVGWFFTISDPLPEVPGAKVVSRFGAFSSRAECSEYRDVLIGVLDRMGVAPAQVTFCEKYEGA